MGDEPPPSAAKALQSHIARLRASLVGVADDLIETTAAGYRLSNADVDAHVFERLASDGHRHLARGDITAATAGVLGSTAADREHNNYFASFGTVADDALVIGLSHNRWDGRRSAIYRPTFRRVSLVDRGELADADVGRTS